MTQNKHEKWLMDVRQNIEKGLVTPYTYLRILAFRWQETLEYIAFLEQENAKLHELLLGNDALQERDTDEQR